MRWSRAIEARAGLRPMHPSNLAGVAEGVVIGTGQVVQTAGGSVAWQQANHWLLILQWWWWWWRAPIGRARIGRVGTG